MNHDATADKGNSRPRRAARRERCKPGLTIKDILAWADSHHRRRGKFPTMHSGVVKDGRLGDSLIRPIASTGDRFMTRSSTG
jgi:hypothetical protein